MLGLQFLCEVFGGPGRRIGGIVEDEIAAFAGEIAGNSSANSCEA
jgi:hypothetical protein